MNWNKLTQPSQLEEIKALSFEKPVLIFKHSTRCSISSMSLDRQLPNCKEADKERLEPFFLEVIAYRNLSDQIEDFFGVPHQSPQVLLIKDGTAVYNNSHFGISYPEIMSKIS